TVSRMSQDLRTGINIATIMHETAHQLSFNSGLLDRDADVPVWLAEGLACYCESTDTGTWQGVGEPNPDRLPTLAAHGPEEHNPPRERVEGDGWVRGGGSVRRVVIGYAQSWALFRMLMEERPAALRTYLELVKSRRTPDHRLTDFLECFGADLDRLELRLEQ